MENDELIVTCNDGQDLFEYRLAPSPQQGSYRRQRSPTGTGNPFPREADHYRELSFRGGHQPQPR
ncbi:MAG: hypothetical protein R2788_03400 [Saprospiraceae bacterium]